MRKERTEEVDEAVRKEAEVRRKAQLLDLRNVLATDSGYRLLCRILDECRLFDSVWAPSAEIHKNAGKQEFGQWLWREVAQAAPGVLGQIVTELTMREPVMIPKAKED